MCYRQRLLSPRLLEPERLEADKDFWQTTGSSEQMQSRWCKEKVLDVPGDSGRETGSFAAALWDAQAD